MFYELIKWEFAKRQGKIVEYYRKKGVTIGNNCELLGKVNFGSEPYLVTIGDKVKITAGVRFITHDGGVNVLRNMGLLPGADIFGPIKVGNNVFFGNFATIMPGVTIGDNVVIGTCAVVTKDIPSNTVVAGVPARIVKTLDKYYEKAKERADFTKSFSYEEKRNYLFKKYNTEGKSNISE